MTSISPHGCLVDTPNLRLSAQLAPWDSVIHGNPVGQIQHIEVLNERDSVVDYAQYENWRDAQNVGLVSCRISHDRLRESMFLEQKGFRFIEMVLHPRLDGLQQWQTEIDTLLITPAEASDLESLQDIAQHAFGFERFHVDPRLNPRLGDQRYGRWVKNSLNHESQRLIKVLDGERLIAFFVIECGKDQSVYWHLTAVAPKWQGQGYGRRAWRAMLQYHKMEGYHAVATTISARNTPVLNLYSQLQFRFTPPEMTFHWLREK